LKRGGFTLLSFVKGSAIKESGGIEEESGAD
jgi:hypothetical protein